MKITIEYVAGTGDMVDVKNYRRKGAYESGTVVGVTVKMNSYDTKKPYHVFYEVRLTRKSATGNLLFLTVGDSNNKIRYLYTPQ